MIEDNPEMDGCFHAARGALITNLFRDRQFKVLSIPIGFYEGVLLARELESDRGPYGASMVYRVWREDAAFQSMLSDLSVLHRDGLVVTGGLVRFHASAKATYPEEMIRELLAAGITRTKVDSLAQLLAGRARLSRGAPDDRTLALRLAQEILPQLPAGTLQTHIFRTMRYFIELEQIRGEDFEDDTFPQRERALNLAWHHSRSPTGKIIYCYGRGDSIEPLPTDRATVDFHLAVALN